MNSGGKLFGEIEEPHVSFYISTLESFFKGKVQMSKMDFEWNMLLSCLQ